MTLTAANNPPNNADAQAIIAKALAELERNNPNQTDGKWLEEITVSAAPHLKDWDIDQAWSWGEWPERAAKFPNAARQDIGIDVVAVRSDGGLIAIQCKARQLDANGRGDAIHKAEIDKFIAASTHALWQERWLITNGDNPLSSNAEQLTRMDERQRPLKLFNIHNDLLKQQEAATQQRDPCPHCETDADTDTPDGDAADGFRRRARWCMQDEAVADSVHILQEHAQSESGGLPAGQARGKIILPCGTGKTRISLRIIEELTPPGELAIVLCPSIALVSQIRGEYLRHAAAPLRALAVCSDADSEYNRRKKEDQRNTDDDPAADVGNVGAAAVRGQVTTDAAEIADWIERGRNLPKLSVIFGTYQSSHRIGEALLNSETTAQVMIADEAHRTAGVRRRPKQEQRLRDFTVCHDNDRFPAKFRIYQTATPRVYSAAAKAKVADKDSDWMVRDMNEDEPTFGVELYRKSYQEAVANGWLSDYRIIALGINDPDAYAAANELAAIYAAAKGLPAAGESKGKKGLTTIHFLNGLAFAMALGGAAQSRDAGPVSVKSCIAFMNTVDNSKNMTEALRTDTVRNWLKGWLERNRDGQPAAKYELEHLDASNDVNARNAAKERLAQASANAPHGILNVGIFGEGTDSPSLSAVAFLEPRKSPIDVIQAVGRAMRTAPGKDVGYIICPIRIPPNADAETWLSTANPEDGWRELGQILLALRAHDSRIEDNLMDLMDLYLPKPAEVVHTLAALVLPGGANQPIKYRIHAGPPGEAQEAIRRVLDGQKELDAEFALPDETETGDAAPTQIVTGKRNSDGTNHLRQEAVVRDNPGADGAPGPVNYAKSKALARKIINETEPAAPVIDPPPKPPRRPERILVAVPGDAGGVSWWDHSGAPGAAAQKLHRIAAGESTPEREFQPVTAPPEPAPPPEPSAAPPADAAPESAISETAPGYQTAAADPPAAPPEPDASNAPEPAFVLALHKNPAGEYAVFLETAVRDDAGQVNHAKTWAKAQEMMDQGTGLRVDPRTRRTAQEIYNQAALELLDRTGMAQHGNAIRMNLLAKSGLSRNRVMRDLNLLENSVRGAARYLREDELIPDLNRHFGLDNLKSESLQKQADGCTIAALLLMNAMMLHQRIANGGWLHGISSLATIKNDTNPIDYVTEEWGRIISHDFRPVLQPALDAIYAIKRTRKQGGLERALHHLAAAAEDIAETYADMGADHAGPLFNQVMGNQASDGAFFTRPAAASIAARLTLDACESPAAGESPAAAPDWTSPAVWRQHKAVDLACGSGTLLAALLTEMKRRARQQGAADTHLAALQKIAVEETIKGMDINPVSLQLAASQLTAGNHDIRYRKMGLHLMPYGPQPGAPAPTAAGTLELLGQQAIVPRPGALDLGDDQIRSQAVWPDAPNPELEDAVEAAKDARIVIMNPPFTNRAKMGEKFPAETQRMLRARADALEQTLVRNDPDLAQFGDKNALRPLFVALAEKCNQPTGVLTSINPTVSFCAPSGLPERTLLAQRYHIHTILTCHQPGQTNLSQNTNINESIIVAVRNDGPKPPTRFINLDRMPVDDAEVDDLHQCLAECGNGAIANGWGEVSWWPAERIAVGDWTPAVWRSPELAAAAAGFANDNHMQTIAQTARAPWKTGALLFNSFEPTVAGTPGSFPILKSKSADSQQRIQSQPDEWWIPKKRDESIRQANGGTYPEADKILAKAGHLLITFGQDNSTARLTATADDNKYIGNGYMPVTGLSATEAKALAVFINSTPGRLQLMRNAGRKLTFPIYNPAVVGNIRIPDVKDARIRQILAGCWEATRGMEVPQFRDGECEVRQKWDAAVAEALGWDEAELTRLRQLLHQEPHVRGLGYNQYADAAEG